jgi:hypothetical protein
MRIVVGLDGDKPRPYILRILNVFDGWTALLDCKTHLTGMVACGGPVRHVNDIQNRSYFFKNEITSSVMSGVNSGFA